MFTYEDFTDNLLKAAEQLQLTTHPEFWLNSRSLEREFACICHTGNCEDADQHSSCTISFTWGPLDTALSLDGPTGICSFFHEDEDESCPHLHMHQIPPLILDLSYSLALNGASISQDTLLNFSQQLKLQASENSRRTIETRPSISLMLEDGILKPDAVSLQQRVELPIWHPEGLSSLHNVGDVISETPRHEDWLPRIFVEIAQDILQVLAALDATIRFNTYNTTENH